jgi:hypothetical protein
LNFSAFARGGMLNATSVDHRASAARDAIATTWRKVFGMDR